MSPPRAVVVDDHESWRRGARQSLQGHVDVVDEANCVEALLARSVAADLVLLDLRLDSPRNRTPTGAVPMIGTAAVRAVAPRLPVLVHTSVPGDLQLAACVAAGALGVVGKDAPPSVVGEAARSVVAGTLYLDPALAGLLVAHSRRQHAGVLGEQQALAMKHRARGLSLQEIADEIGVRDPRTVHKYLKSATERLSLTDVDDAARRLGLDDGLVRPQDLQPPRPTPRVSLRPPRRRP